MIGVIIYFCISALFKSRVICDMKKKNLIIKLQYLPLLQRWLTTGTGYQISLT